MVPSAPTITRPAISPTLTEIVPVVEEDFGIGSVGVVVGVGSMSCTGCMLACCRIVFSVCIWVVIFVSACVTWIGLSHRISIFSRVDVVNNRLRPVVVVDRIVTMIWETLI